MSASNSPKLTSPKLTSPNLASPKWIKKEIKRLSDQHETILFLNKNQDDELQTWDDVLKVRQLEAKCKIKRVPNLKYTHITVIKLRSCKLELLTSLPKTLEILDVSNNNLKTLPTIPSKTRYINISYNQITTFDNLSRNLEALICNDNEIINCELPNSLQHLNINNNKLCYLKIPENLEYFHGENNKFYEIPYFPKSITLIKLTGNKIHSENKLQEAVDLFTKYTQLTNLQFDEVNIIYDRQIQETVYKL